MSHSIFSSLLSHTLELFCLNLTFSSPLFEIKLFDIRDTRIQGCKLLSLELLTIKFHDTRFRQDVPVVKVGGDDAVVDHPVGVDAVERVEPGDAESGTLNITVSWQHLDRGAIV